MDTLKMSKIQLLDNKPIIIFYEPFEIMIKDTTKYLQET
jgi:hypothetical protein